LRQILKSVLKKRKFLSQAIAAEIIFFSTKILEKKFPDYKFKIQSFKNGNLQIFADNSAISQEIFLFSEEILTKLRQKFPNNFFREIRIKIN